MIENLAILASNYKTTIFALLIDLILFNKPVTEQLDSCAMIQQYYCVQLT